MRILKSHQEIYKNTNIIRVVATEMCDVFHDVQICDLENFGGPSHRI